MHQSQYKTKYLEGINIINALISGETKFNLELSYEDLITIVIPNDLTSELTNDYTFGTLGRIITTYTLYHLWKTLDLMQEIGYRQSDIECTGSKANIYRNLLKSPFYYGYVQNIEDMARDYLIKFVDTQRFNHTYANIYKIQAVLSMFNSTDDAVWNLLKLKYIHKYIETEFDGRHTGFMPLITICAGWLEDNERHLIADYATKLLRYQLNIAPDKNGKFKYENLSQTPILELNIKQFISDNWHIAPVKKAVKTILAAFEMKYNRNYPISEILIHKNSKKESDSRIQRYLKSETQASEKPINRDYFIYMQNLQMTTFSHWLKYNSRLVFDTTFDHILSYENELNAYNNCDNINRNIYKDLVQRFAERKYFYFEEIDKRYMNGYYSKVRKSFSFAFFGCYSGKTSFLKSFIHKKFKGVNTPREGLDGFESSSVSMFNSTESESMGLNCRFYLSFSTPFESGISTSLQLNANVGLYFFDLSAPWKVSHYRISNMYHIMSLHHSYIPALLIGTKSDLVDESKLTKIRKKALDMACIIGAYTYIETSAKNNLNLSYAMRLIAMIAYLDEERKKKKFIFKAIATNATRRSIIAWLNKVYPIDDKEKSLVLDKNQGSNEKTSIEDDKINQLPVSIELSQTTQKSSKTTQPILSKVVNKSVEYHRHEVLDDGDCGYAAFGITRQHAVQLLQTHKNTLHKILQPAIKEVLVTEQFVSYLYQKGTLAKTTSLNSITEKLDQFSQDLSIIAAYIDYDVKDKQVDAGWAHPAVLMALAQIQTIPLSLWQFDESDHLVPHQDERFRTYRPASTDQPDKHLVFVNGNHFELLEFTYLKNNIEQPNTKNIVKKIQKYGLFAARATVSLAEPKNNQSKNSFAKHVKD